MQNIINYACGDDYGCVFSLYREYLSNLNSDELKQLQEFTKSPDCEDTCCDYIYKNLITPFYGFMQGIFCNTICNE